MLALYFVISHPGWMREAVDRGWGELLLGSCCASAGLGAFAAGLLWLPARFARRRRRGADDGPPPTTF